MREFKEQEKRVKAERIETREDAYRLADAMEANYIDEKSFLTESGTDTTFIISGPRFGRAGNTFELHFSLGMWFVENSDRRKSMMSDREFNKTYIALQEEGPRTDESEAKPPISILWDGEKDRNVEKWLGEDFVGWSNRNVSGETKDEIVLTIVFDGNQQMEVPKNAVLTRAGNGKVYILNPDQVQGAFSG